MEYVLTMNSDEYGAEEFRYDTHEEAMQGQRRIERKAEELNDGVVRFFSINTDTTNNEGA